MMAAQPNTPGSFVHRTWFIAFTSACTIIALPLSVYLFVRSDRHPMLSYSVQSPRSVVVDPREASTLQFSVGSRIITIPVVAVQVRITNDGTDSIRQQQVLEIPEIVVSGKVNIFAARVLSRSREITQFTVGTVSNNRVPLHWRILEPSDAAVIQVVYGGAPSAGITIEGAIEGQRHIQRVEPKTSWRNSLKGFGTGIVTMVIVFGVMEIVIRTGMSAARDVRQIVVLTALLTSITTAVVLFLFGIVH